MSTEVHPRYSEDVIEELDRFVVSYDAELLAIRSLSAAALRYKLRRDPETAEVYQQQAELRKQALPK